MKILFCTDGSKISFNALKNLAAWIKEATIDTISVIDWNILPDEINVEDKGFSSSCANVADSILDYAEEESLKLGFNIGERIKTCGSVIESILEQTKNTKYDLILMGSHGKKGIQRWLGSVSQEIINSSHISNYIAKEENENQKVLFTTDGTECSLYVIERIIKEINLDNKEIHICMVNEDPNFLFLEGTLDSNWLLDILRQQQMHATNAIESIKKIIENNGFFVNKTKILSGIPAQEIINYSKNNKIDLIILGSRNKSKMDRFLLGSVSKRVIENVTSDVWLVRCES